MGKIFDSGSVDVLTEPLDHLNRSAVNSTAGQRFVYRKSNALTKPILQVAAVVPVRTTSRLSPLSDYCRRFLYFLYDLC